VLLRSLVVAGELRRARPGGGGWWARCSPSWSVGWCGSCGAAVPVALLA